MKELLIRNRPGTPNFEVYYEGGGELPVDLSGAYTSEKEAQKAIDLYLIKKNRKDATVTGK